MRVLMISLDPTIAGAPGAGDARERHIGYARALRRHCPGARVDAVVRVPRSSRSGTSEIADGLVIHPVPCARSSFALAGLRTCATLTAHAPIDVVTTQTPFDDGLIGVWLKRRRGIPLNVQMHSSFLDSYAWMRHRPIVYRAFNRLGKWVADRADTIRVVSLGEQRRLEQRFPHLRRKLVCLPPMINRTTFEAPIRPEELAAAATVLQRYGLGGAPFFLFVGRLSPEKNIGTILRAFARAREGMSQAALVLAGDGPLRVQLEREAGALGIGARVVWLGALRLPALRAWFASATAVLLPSFYEGFPRVVVESYLMYTPAIVTPLISAHELVRDGETGFVAPGFDNVTWFGDRMTFLLRHPEKARAMGHEGNAHVRSWLPSEGEFLDRLVGMWRATAGVRRAE